MDVTIAEAFKTAETIRASIERKEPIPAFVIDPMS